MTPVIVRSCNRAAYLQVTLSRLQVPESCVYVFDDWSDDPLTYNMLWNTGKFPCQQEWPGGWPEPVTFVQGLGGKQVVLPPKKQRRASLYAAMCWAFETLKVEAAIFVECDMWHKWGWYQQVLSTWASLPKPGLLSWFNIGPYKRPPFRPGVWQVEQPSFTPVTGCTWMVARNCWIRMNKNLMGNPNWDTDKVRSADAEIQVQAVQAGFNIYRIFPSLAEHIGMQSSIYSPQDPYPRWAEMGSTWRRAYDWAL